MPFGNKMEGRMEEPIDGSLLDAICENGKLTAIIPIVTMILGYLFFLKVASKETRSRVAQPAKDRWLHFYEDYFIAPFAPNSLQSFIMFTFFFWFLLTIPMGVTRYYEGYWAMDYLTQQGPFNFIAHLIGCKGLNLTTLKYTERVPPRSEWVVNPEHYSAQELDPFFTWHLAAGTTWLTAGFLQIFWAKWEKEKKEGGWSNNPLQHRKLHKRFGWFVCMPALMVHLIFATRMAIRNPVNQAPIIVSQYGAMIFEGFVLFCVAVKYALDSEKAGDKEKKRKLMGMHKLRMVNCYIQTIFGSGAIRVSLWILYLLGHFFSPEIQARIDRGTCQTAAHDERGQPLGSAENCWVPVFLNLALTNVLNTWLLYVCMVTDEFDGDDVTKFKSRFRMALRVMVAATFVALVPSRFDNSVVMLCVMYALMALGVLSRMSSLYDFVGSWKRDTGRVVYVERARTWLFYLIGLEEEEEVGKSTKQN